MIESGLGVAIVPETTWQDSISSHNIRLLRLKTPVCRHIVMKTGNGYFSKAAFKLQQHIIDCFQ
jgi:DNA-binding transcriptional LysR family regulator